MAEARLRDLPTGGRTPLAHGLRLAPETFQRSEHRGHPALPVLLSDGRANVPLTGGDTVSDALAQARTLRAAGIQALVLDSEVGVVRLGLAGHLAIELDAVYRELGALDAHAVGAAVRALHTRSPRDG